MIEAALIAGAFLYGLKLVMPSVERLVSVAERRTAVMERTGSGPITDPDPMPAHLMSYVTDESEEWARADKAKRLRELYDEFKDWNKVENQLALEEMGESVGVRS